MKLAEALQRRADLNRRIRQINSRLESNAVIQEGSEPQEDPAELLAELEQNIFRGTIRSSGEDKDYHFYLFINFRSTRMLIPLIQQRYQNLHGHVEITEQPDEVELERMMTRKNGKTAQAIVRWHDDNVNNGEEYTYEQMRTALSLGQRQIETARRNNGILRKLLDAERIPGAVNHFKKAGQWYFMSIEEAFGDIARNDDNE